MTTTFLVRRHQVGAAVARLALGLGSAALLAAMLALGSRHPLPTFVLLLEGLCAGLAAIASSLALARRRSG